MRYGIMDVIRQQKKSAFGTMDIAQVADLYPHRSRIMSIMEYSDWK
jgi:hypothetical protein